MSLENQCLPVFAGHQTFHPRFGWLKKAVDAVVQDQHVFTKDEAPVTLGVGKNMVEAIRFWSAVFGLTVKSDSSRGAGLLPTQFAEAFLLDGGLDPYLEDESSLWILHWRALSAPSMLPVWWIALNSFSSLEFTEEELSLAAQSTVEQSSLKVPTFASIQKDVDCMIRMYCTKDLRGRQTWEDLLDSPFRSLGLIQTSPGRQGAFRMKTPNGGHVPSIAIAFAAMEYAGNVLGGAQVLSMSRLLLDPGSPGKVFRISEEELRDAIVDTFGDSNHFVNVASAAGALMLTINGDPFDLAHDALIEYHVNRGVRRKKRRSTMLSGPASRLPSKTFAETNGQFTFAGGDV